jgi:hypothetical protein
MNESGLKLLNLLFNNEESICVSPDEYGYKSIPLQEMLLGSFVLLPSTEKQRPVFCNPQDIKLVAINPIQGSRNDGNVTAFRSFLVELDDGPLSEQFEYVKAMGMPYSACVFSGGKSLHFAITLDKDLPSYEVWRFYAEWILGSLPKADQQTKNPSRSIRMAGNMRGDSEMKLINIGSRISLETLVAWLSQFDGAMPRPQEKPVYDPDSLPDIDTLPEWVREELVNGIDTSKGRNNRWYSIAYECSLRNWSQDDTISLLEVFFQPERDFGRKEWEIAIKSGVSSARKKLGYGN